MDLRTNLTSDG